jgi:hypothetical protein
MLPTGVGSMVGSMVGSQEQDALMGRSRGQIAFDHGSDEGTSRWD